MIKANLVAEHIVKWLTDYSNQSNTKGFVVGVSGGIDSAVTSTLAAKTGKEVLVLDMPIHQAENQSSRSEEHINWLKDNFANVSSKKIDLTAAFDSFSEIVSADANDEKTFLSLANTRARLRMTTLYYYAAINGYLVAGTGNKVEDFGVGFYTKYGDGGVDISPIADLYKTEVFGLAKELKIVDSIQKAPPTDGLWDDGRTDEDQLGASYAELEWAMKIGENADENSLNTREKEIYKLYQKLHNANLHKMNPIPVCEIPKALLG